MMRWTLTTLAALVLCASAAFAETPQPNTQQSEVREATRYSNTAERWRGRPALRAASLAHPVAEPTASEKVYEHVPSVNFMLEGQAGGAFTFPRF